MRPSSAPPLLAIVVLAVSLAGCETTGDPRAGGIFWSEAKAQDRISARQSESLAAKDEAASERARTSQLEARRSAIQSTVKRQRAELARIEEDIAALRRQLSGAPGATKRLEADLKRLEANLKRVKRQRTELATNDSLSVSEKGRELVNLRAEVNRLKERNRLLRETR